MRVSFIVMCLCSCIPVSMASTMSEYGIEEILTLGLPVLVIQTQNSEEPTCDYLRQSDGYPLSTITNATKVPGRLLLIAKGDTLYDSGDYDAGVSGMTIKIRGNSSAYERKKSYKLKLEKKADLLSRTDNNSDFRDKNWVLLKTNEMYSTLNIMVGFKINKMLGLSWTPASRYVNVVLNGDYRGVYALAESVRRNVDCRLNVDKQTGFIVEYDPYYWNEDFYVESSIPSSMHSFKYPEPEDISEQQLEDATYAIQEMEQSIINNITSKIDISSFVNWLMAHDILGTLDSHGSNIFLLKYDNTEQTKVQMCNLWDFDTIMLTEGNWAKVHMLGLFLYYYLFHYNNAQFMDAYISRWKEIETNLFTSVDEWLEYFAVSEDAIAIEESQRIEALRYNRSINSVYDDISFFRQWFRQRKCWMDSQLLGTDIHTIENKRFEHNNYYDLKGVISNYFLPGIVVGSNKKWLCR